jgi:hypothetical protein
MIRSSCQPMHRRPSATSRTPLEAGHFAPEIQGPETAAIIRDFLERKLPKQAGTS